MLEENKMPAMLLLLLKQYWKELVIVGLVVGAFAYLKVLHLQIEHYKSVAAQCETKLREAEGREQQLGEANKEITKRYNKSLKDVYSNSNKLDKYIKEDIKKNEEIAKLRVSADSVRLFNKSKLDPATTTTDTIERNVGETNPSSTSTNSQTESTVSLTAIYEVSAENDKNHWKCVKQVEDWQGFWQDYVIAVTAFGKPNK